jgi:hypothetical protein
MNATLPDPALTPHILLSTAPEIWLRRSHQSFMASGVVSYYKQNPLDILAGKRSRTYGIDKTPAGR